jgi:hypothetical protein
VVLVLREVQELLVLAVLLVLLAQKHPIWRTMFLLLTLMLLQFIIQAITMA